MYLRVTGWMPIIQLICQQYRKITYINIIGLFLNLRQIIIQKNNSVEFPKNEARHVDVSITKNSGGMPAVLIIPLNNKLFKYLSLWRFRKSDNTTDFRDPARCGIRVICGRDNSCLKWSRIRLADSKQDIL